MEECHVGGDMCRILRCWYHVGGCHVGGRCHRWGGVRCHVGILRSVALSGHVTDEMAARYERIL
jgi:hypothetical protein